MWTKNHSQRKQPFKHRTFEEFGGRCAYCRIPMTLHVHGKTKVEGNVATLDHIIPKSYGGPACNENLLVVCFECNRDRGNCSLMHFLRDPRVLARLRASISLSKQADERRRFRRRTTTW